MQPDDRVVLDQHVVGGCLRDTARCEADDDDAALESNAFGRAVVHVAADRVEHDVRAAPTGELLHLFGEVLRLVVDHVVGAHPPAHLELFVGAGGRDDCGPGGLAQLNRRGPHAASPGVDQEGFIGLQIGATMKAEPACLVGERETGRFLEGHTCRHQGDGGGHGVGDLRVAPTGQAAAVEQRHHAVAGLEPARRRCCDHLAADLDPRHERERRFGLVGARNHQGIREVDRGGADGNPYHAVGRLARFYVLEAEDLRTAELPNHPGFHGPMVGVGIA